MIDLEAFGNGFGLVVILLAPGHYYPGHRIRPPDWIFPVQFGRRLVSFNIAFQHSVICSRHQNRPGGSLPGGPGYRLLCC